MTSYPCPVCLAEANVDTGCPGCGRAPDPVAAEVIQLDGRIAELRPRVEAARTELLELTGQLDHAQARRRQLAATVWRTAHPTQPPPARPKPEQKPEKKPETSTQAVKNVLFVLGGILLSIAAIVFTVIAWGQYGMTGKALILGVVTVTTLGVPVLTRRRGLRGTAETFAALGLLLVVLDGYSIWRVNLFGVHGMNGWTYAGLVAGFAAAAAVLYGRWLGLTAPLVFGLAAAQPVLPLVFQPLGNGRAIGISLVFSAVAAANLPVVRLRSSLLQLLSSIAYAISLVVAHGYAFAALDEARGSGELALAAAAALLAGALVLAGPVLRPQPIWLTAATAWCGVLAVLVGMVVAIRLDGHHARLWTVGLTAGLGVAVALAELRGRGAVWRGLLIGFAATGGIAAVALAGFVATGAVVHGGENVAIEVAVLTAATILATRRWRPVVASGAAVVGAVGFALAVPVGFGAAWLPAAADLTATAALLAMLLWTRPPVGVRALIAVGVVILPGHAVVTAADRPPVMAYTLGVMLILAIVTAVVSLRRDPIAGVVAVAVTAPLAVSFAVAVAWAEGGDLVHTMALTALALPIAVWAVRRWYARAADLTARGTILLALLIAIGPPDESWPKSVYVAGAAVALAALPRTGLVERIAGWSVLGLALLLARPPLAVVLEPYFWPLRGQTATAVKAADVVAIAVLAATLWSIRPLLYSALPVPIALATVYFGLTWPWLPLVLLLSGLVLVAYAARRAVWCAPFGLVLAGSGLAGLNTQPWYWILGLTLVGLAALGLGLGSGIPHNRAAVAVPAWLVFGVTWFALALNIARTLGWPDRAVSFAILGAAAVLVLASVYVAQVHRVVEMPAHVAAFAVIVSAPTASRLAEACLVWGVALGLTVFGRLRAPWRSEWLVRLGLAGVLEVAALWAQLISADVTAVEAYSLPVAGAALLIGFLAMRRDPALSSWVGYGPALVAAFGPSLAVILPVSGDPLRRLLLGTAALAVVLAGAVRRRQAPVVIGGAVLIIAALHEVTQVWSVLPLWLPIGVGGAILVALAITYERRLRDLRTLRTRISSYT